MSGAGRGIGAAIARSLDAAGARVALVARSADELDAVAADLVHDPVTIVADLGTVDGPGTAAPRRSMPSAGASTSSSTTPPISLRKPTEELTAEEIDRVLGVNVRGVLLLTVACLPPMIAAGCRIDRVDQLDQRRARHAPARRSTARRRRRSTG